MKNVKKAIAGVLLTATMLGIGTQLSVGAVNYNLEGSPSEVRCNKRPTNMQDEFYTDSEVVNTLADLFAKSQAKEMEEKEQANMQNVFDTDSEVVNTLTDLFARSQAKEMEEKEQANMQNEFNTDSEVVNILADLFVGSQVKEIGEKE